MDKQYEGLVVTTVHLPASLAKRLDEYVRAESGRTKKAVFALALGAFLDKPSE